MGAQNSKVTINYLNQKAGVSKLRGHMEMLRAVRISLVRFCREQICFFIQNQPVDFALFIIELLHPGL